MGARNGTDPRIILDHAGADTYVVEEPDPPVRRKRHDPMAWLARWKVQLGVVVALIGGGAVGAFAVASQIGRVDDAERRLSALERRSTAHEAQLHYLSWTLYRVAIAQGVAVDPPPVKE